MKMNTMAITKKTSAKMYVRIFPQAKMNWDYVSLSKHSTKIRVRSLQDFSLKRRPNPDQQVNYKYYQTDGIFTTQSQGEIYEKLMENAMQSAFLGNNVVIMAYGQTGSGKTSTISGLHYAYEDRGILPRMIPELFDIKQKQGRVISTRITMSYVEFDRVGVIDLLKPLPNHSPTNAIRDVTHAEMFFEEDVLRNIFLAESRKRYSYSHNYPSNVGSTVVTFTIARKNVSIMNATEKVSKIHVVDLAGFDTVGRPSCSHREPSDIGKTNVVKSQIEQFIMVLGTDMPEQLRVKQRLNAFTHYFGSCLSTSVDVRVIGHITTQFEDLIITHSMLRFGQCIGGLKLNDNLKENLVEDGLSPSLSAMRELEMLRQEKLYQAIFMNDDLCSNLNQDRLAHMRRVAQEYIKEKTSEITVLNVTDANAVLKVIRDYCKELVEAQKDSSAVEYKRGFADGVAVVKASYGKHMRSFSKATVNTKESVENLSDKKATSASCGRTSKRSIKSDTLSSDDTISKRRSSKLGSSSKAARPANKRKSNCDMSPIEKKENKSGSVSEVMTLPDAMPEQDEAWTQFISDETSGYHELVALAKENEKATREIRATYLHEVATLKSLMKENEKRKEELLQAVMIRHYSERNIIGEDGATDAEKSCLQTKKETEKSVIEHQENVLKSQAELRVHLKRHKELKEEIERSFDDYCMTKYKIVLPGSPPDLSVELLDELIFRISGTEMKEKETQLQESEPESAGREKKHTYGELRTFMYKEMKKNDLYKKTHQAWV